MSSVSLVVSPQPSRSRRAQEPSAPQAVSADQLKAAIDKLGDFDYDTRTGAARTVRRTVASQAVPALLQTVAEHADGYVRYRALVLLTGFNDPRTKDAMRESRTSPNDRLRTVAYSFFEHHPDRALVGDLLTALDKEQGEFVRPPLVRALAAHGAMFDDPRIRQTLLREVGRGEDYFRSAVIEALGDYKALYAYDALVAVAKLDGPLQDDAALALGKIGDKRALETLAMLQQTAPRAVATDRRRGDLSARRELRLARELPDRDVEVRQPQPEPRIPGTSARRGGRPRRPGRRRRARRGGRRAVRGRHSFARSDPRRPCRWRSARSPCATRR